MKVVTISQAESNEQRAHQIHQDAIVIDCLFTGREFPRDLSYLKMMHEKGCEIYERMGKKSK